MSATQRGQLAYRRGSPPAPCRPASAAGIFSSNLGSTKASKVTARPDQAAFEDALGKPVLHADTIYRQAQEDSVKAVARAYTGLCL